MSWRARINTAFGIATIVSILSSAIPYYLAGAPFWTWLGVNMPIQTVINLVVVLMTERAANKFSTWRAQCRSSKSPSP